jgi:hypothetical protein
MKMQETFTIKKSVPMPVGGPGDTGKTKYPFSEMGVGDSFAVSVSACSVRSAMRYWRSTHDFSRQFSVRKTPDGYRCWRVA